MTAEVGLQGHDGGSGNGGISSTSSSWVVAHGSLRETISYEWSSSSSLDADEGDPCSRRLLLLNPASDASGSSDPCEITVSFKERHEIHRIYVRSTARVYEIYYASEEPQNDNEYLCTVRCGAAEMQVELPEIYQGQNPIEGQNCSNQTCDLSENSTSNNGSEDDGWIEVKVPDSPSLDDRTVSSLQEADGSITSNVQVCYEATAEISDASPCISLTLRFLSIQSKACVYIDEIYLYADPVEFESTNSGPSTSLGGNLAENTLLSMLVPGLLQLSKKEDSRIPDISVLSKPVKPTCEGYAVENTEKSNPGTQILEEKSYTMENPDTVYRQASINVKSSSKELDSGQQVPVSGSCSASHEGIKESIAIEKVLNELVSRVCRIESFCLKFEENMMRPLSSIEMRLQRMEQQLDILNLRTYCSKNYVCSKFSAPEFSYHESDSEKECDGANALNQNATSDCPPCPVESVVTSNSSCKGSPGLIVTAPEFPQDDDSHRNCNDYMGSEGKNCLDDDEQSLHIGQESPCVGDCHGICNEGYDSSSKNCLEDSTCLFRKPDLPFVDICADIGDESISTEKSILCAKSPFSIETALNSALEAFISSTTSELRRNEHVSSELGGSSEDVNKHQSIEGLVGVLCEGVEDSFIKNSIPNNSYSKEAVEPRMHPKDHNSVETPEETLPQDWYDMTWNEISCDTSPGQGVCLDQINSELTEDCDTEEAVPHTFSKGMSYKGWLEDSSSDSAVDESTVLEQYHDKWTDESSTDSRNEFPLRSWLAACQGHHNNEEIERIADCSPITSLANDSSIPNYEKSKLLIKQALDSILDSGNSILNVEFVPDTTLNGVSSLEELLAETSEVKDPESDINTGPSGILLQKDVEPTLLASVSQFPVDIDSEGSSLNVNFVSGNIFNGVPFHEELLAETSETKDSYNDIETGPNDVTLQKGIELNLQTFLDHFIVDIASNSSILNVGFGPEKTLTGVLSHEKLLPETSEVKDLDGDIEAEPKRVLLENSVEMILQTSMDQFPVDLGEFSSTSADEEALETSAVRSNKLPFSSLI